MTLDEVYNLWVVWKERMVKRSTILLYKSQYIRTIRPALGDKEISELTKKTIIPILYGWVDKGYSEKYCGDMLIIIRMIMRFAEDELEESNVPSTTWKMVWPADAKRSDNKIVRYEKNDLNKIIGYLSANPSHINLAILLVCCTGMRIGEICGLRWEDIDIDRRLIRVSRTYERVWNAEARKSELIMSSTKTRSSTREIPIIPALLPMVKNFSKTVRPDYYVCTGSPKPLESRTLRNLYRDVVINKVGLDHVIKFHGLRHTFASSLIESGVDVKTTAAILGHADVSTTLNVYVHPSEDNKRMAINRAMGKIGIIKEMK